MFTNQDFSAPYFDKMRRQFQSDCANCFGLCCAALYFSASDGFPHDKEAGRPCDNLQPDFRCSVHLNLKEHGLKGCLTFECFGAGQKVAQISYSGKDWRDAPQSASQMFEAFLIMRQLHELLWYLNDVLTFELTSSIHGTIKTMIEKTEQLTNLCPTDLIKLDIPGYRAEINTLLIKASELVRQAYSYEKKTPIKRQKLLGRGADLIGTDLRKVDLRGANLRGAYLIAADLRETDLSGADLIGADFRDANIEGADLTRSIFLTQFQVNAAKGDSHTKLPPSLNRPSHWV